MGIPNYFSWIVRHFKDRIIINKLPFEQVHRFYLDLNCLIHPVVKSHPEYSIDAMCDQVIHYMNYLIQYVNPSVMIYIAIDGVAPVAKMKQQRLRRYKSVKEKEEINDLKRHFGMDINNDKKDFNMISPGTKFMSLLSIKIEQLLKTGLYRPRTVILSDSSVPGEGEHKILQDLKQIQNDSEIRSKCVSVIYGLDSDLIMLSMITRIDNIFLLREEMVFKNVQIDLSTNQIPQLQYLCIKELKTLLYLALINGQINISSDLDAKSRRVTTTVDNDPQNQELDTVIRDYIFMSFLLSNDFVPAFPSLRIKDDGIEQIINAYYHTVYLNHSRLLNQDFTMNIRTVINFLTFLSKMEEKTLHKQKTWRERHNSSIAIDPYQAKTFQEALDLYQNIESKWLNTNNDNDPIKVDQPNWQCRYYMYFFNIQIIGNEYRYQSLINQVCYQYLGALDWIIRYYFDRCCDWYWCYPYHSTPLLSDLVECLQMNPYQRESVQMSPKLFNRQCPMTPFQQLMMILPPQSAKLLPKPYRPFMISDRSPLIHYYPQDFQLDYYGHRYRWECYPKIPLVDPFELLTHISHLDQYLSPDEKKRGELGQNKQF